MRLTTAIKGLLAVLLTLAATSVLAATAYVQSKTTVATSNANFVNQTATTIAVTLTGVVAGNVLALYVSYDTAGGPASMTGLADNRGNTYTVLQTIEDTTAGQKNAIAYAPVTTGGSVTITATFSATVCCRILMVHEISGVDPVAPLDVFKGQQQTANTTAADNVTSTAVTTTRNGDYIFGVSSNDSVNFNTDTTAITKGTPFTQRENIPISVGNPTMTEDMIQTTAGSIAATFKYSVTNRRSVNFIMAFKPPPTLGSFVITPGLTSASTCAPNSISITARDTNGNTFTSYTGTVTLSTSTNNGDWTVNTANNTITPVGSDNGSATYTFLVSDAGTITLNLSDLHVETLTVTVRDNSASVQSTSSSITYGNTDGPTGLIGTYYDQNNVSGQYFTGDSITRIDSTVDFNFGTAAPAEGIGTDNYSVRWTGYFIPPTTGNYTFYTRSDEGVRLYFNNSPTPIINNWTSHTVTTNTSALINGLTANARYPIVMEYYDATGVAEAHLQYGGPGIAANTVIPNARLLTCVSTGPASMLIAAAPTASTCTPLSVTITIRSSTGATLTGYLGTITLSTSNGNGDWSIGNGTGTLVAGAADSGSATYTFAASDSGVVTLGLSNQHAENVTVTAADTLAAVSATSASISFSNNAFVVTSTEPVVSANVPIAGRPHAMNAAVWRKDATTGVCSIATAYTGSRNLKAWLSLDTSNPAGSVAPGIADSTGSTTLLSAVSSAVPASNNLTLGFSAGQAAFKLTTTDVGKWVLNLRDDKKDFAAVNIDGSSPTLTVRPFALVTSPANPTATTVAGSVLTSAGSNFTGTITAVQWQAVDDANDDGIADAGADLSGNSPTTHYAWLTNLAATTPYYPAAGTLGTLSPASVAQGSFTNGAASVSTLQYSEVGSFTFSATASNFLNSGVTVPSGGSTLIGRFTPHHFVLSGAALANRTVLGCSTSSFSYMGEGIGLNFTLTAVTGAATPTTTQNYSTSLGFSRLPSTAGTSSPNSTLGFGAVSGTTNLTARTADQTTSPTITWTAGQATVTAVVAINRPPAVAGVITPDGPYANLRIGVAPSDQDAVGLLSSSLTMDVDSTGGNDHVQIGANTEARFGRLRIFNAVGSDLLALPVAVETQYWNGTGFVTNTADSCTPVARTNVAFSNWQNKLPGPSGVGAACGTGLSPTNTTVSVINGRATLKLTAPGANKAGSVDLTVNLGAAASGRSCPVTTDTAADTGNRAYLQGAWAGATGYNQNPTARVGFGLFRSSSDFIYLRENY